MDPEFWHDRWSRGETGWHQDEINVHLQEHWPRLEVKAGETIFVPLCGKTQDLLWLASRGLRVIGVEVSPVAVETFFAENGLKAEISDAPPFRRYRVDEVELLCGDFFDLTLAHLGDVGAVFDRASLIAMPPEMRPRYVAHLRGLLRPQTRILLVTLEYPQAEMMGPPFAVAEAEVRALLGSRFDIERLVDADVWAENQRFQQRGLSALREQVYQLRPRSL